MQSHGVRVARTGQLSQHELFVQSSARLGTEDISQHLNGGEVATGQVIGLIEAMKLYNEIKSDLSGRVVKVHAEDGKLVKARQPLIEVDPL